jgi:3-hydroxyacyl-[acyl-carrier-protein] dehydratase
MRFTLLDRITHLEPGKSIEAVKNLSLSEEYLADHFPLFPVMPGVLMLEAMTQCGAWLVRASEDFVHSMVVLAEARAVKYADFVRPGQVLTVSAEIISHDAHETKLKAQGSVNGNVSVSARLVLRRFNLADERPDQAASDRVVRVQMRKLFTLLYHPRRRALAAAPTNGEAVGALQL